MQEKTLHRNLSFREKPLTANTPKIHIHIAGELETDMTANHMLG